ncbi:trichoplein keratin filament-binding protein isoform X1 [Nelusetta ayraudi]|uniref:trichoplein keratin filament-binding protein isoform X1 n=2 Tax=Nelusetta ayraudi TaxID=303726 RepID=UPI003F718FBD
MNADPCPSSSSMALPSLQGRPPSRSRVLAAHMVRHREQAARDREQWELHARNWKEMNVRTERQVAWSSTQSYQKSMSAYQRRSQEEEKIARLEQRRSRLRAMLQEEEQRHDAELKELMADRRALEGQRLQEKEAIRSAREDRRKQHVGGLLNDCWGENNSEVPKGESAFHKDHVISPWQEEISQRKKEHETDQKEKPLDKECERTQGEAPDRMKMAERKEEKEQAREEELRKQMEELKLREEESAHLKKEQEALQLKQQELEKLADQRRAVEQKRKDSEIGHFLQRHYRAQLKRRAQQVQEELECDRKILARLLSEGQDGRRTESERRERVIADAAWMKRVIEEQLQLEREREAEFDTLHREEAQRVWAKREAQWEKEVKAREQLMHEVLRERRKQLKLKMQKNREAQVESLKEREELIQRLELEREARRHQREQEEQHVASRMQEVEQRQEQMEHEEEEEDTEARRIQEDEEEEEEELRLEMQRVSTNGHQEKTGGRPRSAWT